MHTDIDTVLTKYYSRDSLHFLTHGLPGIFFKNSEALHGGVSCIYVLRSTTTGRSQMVAKQVFAKIMLLTHNVY